MSTISSVISSEKPVDPNPGSLFYFTDTNQIGIYQGGGVYYMYNKDTSAYTSGGEENLNYSGGIFNSTTSSYYISVAPDAHYDMDFWDGAQKTDWLHTDGTPITQYGVWHGSTNAGANPAYEKGVQVNSTIEGLHSRHLGGGGSVALNNMHGGRTILRKGRGLGIGSTGFYTMGTAGQSGTLDFTYMFVGNSTSGNAFGLGHYSQFSQTAFFINSEVSSSSYKGLYLCNSNTWDTSLGVTLDTLNSVEAGVPTNGKNSIFVVRRKDGVTKYWGSAVADTPIGQTDRRDPLVVIPSTDPLSAKSWNFSYAGNCLNVTRNDTSTFTPEILFWKTALDESDLDKAYLYLLNKYTNAESGVRAMQAVRNDGTVGSVNISDPTSFNLLQV